ncbi:MAG: RluA family pseudouridine synthase [Burkholderiaceae bacterium]|nr:RluA family pseudouridine synthase [Burkholderiaceae bacterium]
MNPRNRDYIDQVDPQSLPGGAVGENAEAILVDAAGGRGERLDRFLAGALPGYSRSRIQRWIALGAVECDERPMAAKTRLKGIERIRVAPQPLEADGAFVAEPIDIEIVYENDALLVLDKPAGLVVHPAPGNWRGTLMNGLLHARAQLAELPRAGIVHRLDKDTSGLMVVAKTEMARQDLVAQLADRAVSRRYLALVCGDAPELANVDQPIGRDPRNRLRMAIREGAEGKPSRTDFVRLALQRLKHREGHGGSVVVSLLECILHTGRTHQIRVHAAAIGLPLCGDSVYGGPSEPFWPRQMLHAWRLGLRSPEDGKPMQWTSRVPDDMAAALADAGIDTARLPEPARPHGRSPRHD